MAAARSDAASAADNPLLGAWDTPYGLPPFAAIRAEHFPPAFEAAMQAHRDDVDAIAASREAPTFANTIRALDRAGRLLERTSGVFHNLAASETSPELQAVQRDLAPRLAAHGSWVHTHAGLLAREG